MKKIKSFNGPKHDVEYKVFFIKYKDVSQKKGLHLVKRKINEPHYRIIKRMKKI